MYFLRKLFPNVYHKNLIPVVVQQKSIMSRDTLQDETSMVFVTCPNKEVASSLARSVVEKKLVACCNVIPGLTSYYEWQGKIESDEEVLLMMKTRSNRVEDIAKFMKENHPYDVPEVISSKIDNGLESYLNWIRQVVPPKLPENNEK